MRLEVRLGPGSALGSGAAVTIADAFALVGVPTAAPVNKSAGLFGRCTLRRGHY
jgi:hypothetical protein